MDLSIQSFLNLNSEVSLGKSLNLPVTSTIDFASTADPGVEVLSVQSNLYLNSTVRVISEVILPMYGSILEADNYFQKRLRSKLWFEATNDEKIASLIEATRLIDRLNFMGLKTCEEQFLQFPRGRDTRIPYDIHYACYEIGIKLLDDYDPDMEIENLGSLSQGFGGLRDTYDRAYVVEHIRAGIPSALAWSYLKPYLPDPQTVRLSRVD